MKRGRTQVLIWIILLAMSGSAHADVVLETNRACDGTLLDKAQRLEITSWDGDSREALGGRVYDFRVRCEEGERDGIDLFLAAERSDRYKREGNTLMRLERTDRKSVKIKDAGCEQVPKQVQRPPPDDEIRETCRNQRMPMACEIDMLAQKRWVTEMVEECWRAEYETRDVPVWASYPDNYAPLPRGARIVKVATKAPPAAATAPVGPTGGTTAPTATAGQQGSGGSWLGTILIAMLAAAGTFYYVQRKTRETLREQVASARSQMGGDHADYGANFRDDGFRDDGFKSSSGGSERERSYAHEEDQASEGRHESRHETNTEQPKPDEDELATTVAEACKLLNVTPDTPPEMIDKIYKAMIQAWHPDKAKNETERKLHELKSKQLNAAKDLLLNKK
ncbi:MAG: J domain-containing protein [Hyphomicrobiaceae bacterium]|nr:J domain-containing protein [Hyphomicrobiaceae bacterium]